MASDHEALQAVIDANDQPVFALDRDLRYAAFNRAHADVMRALYGADIAIGGRLPEYQTVAADRVTSVANLERALAGEQVAATAFSGKEGQQRIFEVVHSPQLDDAGTIIGVVVRAYDVTERQRAEAALNENRTLLAAVVESTNDAIYVKDTAGRYLLFNAAAERITGKRAADVLGNDDRFVFPADEAAVVMDGDRVVMDSGVQATYEETVTDASGTLATFLSTKGPIYDEGGELQGLFGIARNISERRQAEEQLRASEAHLQATLDSTADGILAVDDSGRVLVANRRFAEFWRIPDDLLKSGDDAALLTFVMDQLADPEAFLSKVQSLYGSDATDVDTLAFKDGRVFERHSSPTMQGSIVTGRVWSFSDVTERRRAEADLRETRDYLENLFGYANAPVIVWDPKLRITRFNHAFEELTQRSADEVIGRHLELLFPEDERRKQALQHVTEASAGERWQVVEIPILRANGEVRTVLWNSATVYGADGVTPIATIAQGQDITERANAEKALRESEDKFKYVFDHSLVGKSITQLNGEISVNKAFCDMLGYTPEELRDRTWQEISHPDDIEETQQRLEELQSGAADSVRFLKRYLNKNGSVVWADVATALRRDEDGRPLYFITAVVDITERVAAENELRASERKFHDMIQALDEGYYSVTFDGRLLDHNPAYGRILGMDPEADLRGQHTPDFWWDPADRADYVARLNRDGAIRDYLARAKKQDGSPLVVLLSAHLVRDEHGAVERIDGGVVDFTARKAAEDEIVRLNADLEQRVLDRTAQLDAANKELEAFAYSVSHDLRAPLRHISGFSALLAERVGEGLDEKSSHYVDTISRSVREMGVLIDDLLQFSRTGRAELTIEPVDMNATLAEALEPLRREGADRDIEWTIGRLPDVVGDHALLRQVWTNLLDNAVKYSRNRAPARIEVGARDGDGAGEDVFWVRDNGVGFDMQYAHKLFGVFQRLHSASEFEGTGIGLANVGRIVTRLGGRAWGEGEVDHGATFWFSLPRRKDTPS